MTECHQREFSEVIKSEFVRLMAPIRGAGVILGGGGLSRTLIIEKGWIGREE